MPIVNEGKRYELACSLNKQVPEDLELCLYKNNPTLSDDMTLLDLEEADFPGYAPIPLLGGNWTIPMPTGDAPAVASYAKRTFTCTADISSQTVNGCFFRLPNAGLLYAVEQFDPPDVFSNNGDKSDVTPIISHYQYGH